MSVGLIGVSIGIDVCMGTGICDAICVGGVMSVVGVIVGSAGVCVGTGVWVGVVVGEGGTDVFSGMGTKVLVAGGVGDGSLVATCEGSGVLLAAGGSKVSIGVFVAVGGATTLLRFAV